MFVKLVNTVCLYFLNIGSVHSHLYSKVQEVKMAGKTTKMRPILYILPCLRPALQVVLLVIFLHYFGVPAVSRYQRREVMVVSSRRDTGGIQAPAITISALSPEDLSGWKSGFEDASITCISNISSIAQKCIEQKTYNQSETLNDVTLGYVKRQSLLNQDGLVTEDFTVTWTLSIGQGDTTQSMYQKHLAQILS